MKLSTEKHQPGVNRLAGDEHVVAPHDEADDGNRQARKRDEAVSENLLARKGGNQFADHAHARQNHDVHGGMGIEPEQMLEQQRIAADCRIEDADVEDALEAQQEQRDRDHRRAQNEDEAGGVHRPDEERQAEPRHSRRSHLVNRDDEIQAGEDRREAGDEDAQRH